MTNAYITRLRNQMVNLRDGYIIDEGINEQLEDLQQRLDNACRREVVTCRMSIEEYQEIMNEVQW